MFYKGKFSVDNSEQIIGYTDGNTWNGWATPFFEKSKLKEMKEKGYFEYFDVTYNKEDDSYYFQDLYEPEDEPEIFKGIDIETYSGKIHVYPIGTCNWTWEVEYYKFVKFEVSIIVVKGNETKERTYIIESPDSSIEATKKMVKKRIEKYNKRRNNGFILLDGYILKLKKIEKI